VGSNPTGRTNKEHDEGIRICPYLPQVPCHSCWLWQEDPCRYLREEPQGWSYQGHLMTKIVMEIEVTSRAHTAEALEAIRVEMRKRTLAFVFDAIDNAKFGLGDGPVLHSNFHVAGDIKLVD
jgi:hypothetical protein